MVMTDILDVSFCTVKAKNSGVFNSLTHSFGNCNDDADNLFI